MLIELFLINLLAWSVAGRFNILLIIVDDLRPALGCYGDNKAHTPNIDDLAKESVIFTQAYAQQSLCAPSRNSFLTSRRPDTLQLYDFYSYWRNTVGNFTTLPEHLRHNGYTTMSVGKVFHPGISSNGSDDSPYSWSEKPFHPYTDRYKEAPVCRATKNSLPKRNLVCPVCVSCMPNGTLPDIETLNAARTFIHKHHEDTNPFFLAVGFQKPHIPLKYPQQYLKFHPLEKFNLPEQYHWPDNVSSVAYNPWTDLRKRDDVEELLLKFPWEKIPPDFAKTIIQSYYAAVTYIDDLIGMLMDQLRVSKIRENTAVILISDHGWSLGEHAEWAKYSNYDVAVRVPVLVSIPSVTFIPHFPCDRNDCPTPTEQKWKTSFVSRGQELKESFYENESTQKSPGSASRNEGMKSLEKNTKRPLPRHLFKLVEDSIANDIHGINPKYHNSGFTQSEKKNDEDENRNVMHKGRVKSTLNTILHQNIQQQKLGLGEISVETAPVNDFPTENIIPSTSFHLQRIGSGKTSLKHQAIHGETSRTTKKEDVTHRNVTVAESQQDYIITPRVISDIEQQRADRDDSVCANVGSDIIFEARRNERKGNMETGTDYMSSFHEDLLSRANAKVSKRRADVNISQIRERRKHLLHKHHKIVHVGSKDVGGRREKLDQIYQSLEKDHEQLMKNHDKLIKDHEKLDEILKRKLRRGRVIDDISRKDQHSNPEYKLSRRNRVEVNLNKGQIETHNNKFHGFNSNEDRAIDEKVDEGKRKTLDLDNKEKLEKPAWKAGRTIDEAKSEDHSNQKPQLQKSWITFELNYLSQVNNHKHDQEILENRRNHLREIGNSEKVRGDREKKDRHLADNVQHMPSSPKNLENIGDALHRKQEEKELLKHPAESQHFSKRRKQQPSIRQNYIKVDSMVELVDIFPTIAELVGYPIPICPEIDDRYADSVAPNLPNPCSEGVSLMPLIEAAMSQKIITWKAATFSQYPRPGMTPTVKPNSDKPRLKEIKIMGYTIRTRKYRYTAWVRFANSVKKPDWSAIEAEELYDQDLDEGENLNLANAEAFRQIKSDLMIQLKLGWRHALPEQYNQKIKKRLKWYEG